MPDAETAIRRGALDALAILLPVECAGCGRADRALCVRCRALITGSPFERRLPDGTPVFSALVYDGVPRHAILALKEAGRTDVARPLGAALATAIAAALATAPTGTRLVRIPCGSRSFRRRGYDPVRLLTRHAGVRRQRPLLANVRSRSSQKTLDLESRLTNPIGSMRARRPLVGVPVVLVDDVVTTGATLGEGARALRSAGATVVAAATLSATPRYTPGE